MPQLAFKWRAMLVEEVPERPFTSPAFPCLWASSCFAPGLATAVAIALALAVSLLVEVQRLKGKIRLPEVRDHEETKVASYIYYMAGSLLCVLLFSTHD